MYTLLSGTYKYLTRREVYYVMIIGLDNAGKTVIIAKRNFVREWDHAL